MSTKFYLKFVQIRGISVSSSAYKMYMTIRNIKLQPTAEQILQEEQCSFQKGTLYTGTDVIMKQILENSREYCHM
jgi:hypothetical protein